MRNRMRRAYRHPPAVGGGLLCENQGMPTIEQILESPARVIDPELRKNIVELEMVRSIEPREDGVRAR